MKLVVFDCYIIYPYLNHWFT